jgi:hypothetical protein
LQKLFFGSFSFNDFIQHQADGQVTTVFRFGYENMAVVTIARQNVGHRWRRIGKMKAINKIKAVLVVKPMSD